MTILNAIYWANKPVKPILQCDFNEGLQDVLLDDEQVKVIYSKDDIEALEWLKNIIKKNSINNENFDKEFKKILATLNKAEKAGDEIGEYRPTVKKAILKIRRAINYRYATRIFFKGYRGPGR